MWPVLVFVWNKFILIQQFKKLKNDWRCTTSTVVVVAHRLRSYYLKFFELFNKNEFIIIIFTLFITFMSYINKIYLSTKVVKIHKNMSVLINRYLYFYKCLEWHTVTRPQLTRECFKHCIPVYQFTG